MCVTIATSHYTVVDHTHVHVYRHRGCALYFIVCHVRWRADLARLRLQLWGLWRWCLAFGVWLRVFGVWCLVYGVWCLALGVWRLVPGVRRLASGRWLPV